MRSAAPARSPSRCRTSVFPQSTRHLQNADLGLQIRAGLHTGECELVDGKVSGIAVHIGARVAAQAQPSEVLVSSTVKDLVAGSQLAFEDRGSPGLKGVPGEWHLFAADPVSARVP